MKISTNLIFTMGAVVLVTVLSMAYTVDGQWRRSAAGDIVCDLQKLNRCVEMGERMLQDPRYVFPDSDSDVRDVCQEWENITMCMEEAMRTCVKFPDNEKQLFNNNVGKSIIYVSEICTKEQEKLEYLQHAPCLKEMTRNDFDYCGSYYGKLLSVTRDFKNGIEKDEELCCGMNLYKECMLGKFNKCQRAMLKVFGEDSFKRGKEYVSGLLDNALNAQSQHCSSLNYVMSSYNCPQMDKLMDENRREQSLLDLDSRNYEPASSRSNNNPNAWGSEERRGGRIDKPALPSSSSSNTAGPKDPFVALNTGNTDTAADISGSSSNSKSKKPSIIEPPGRGPLRDRVAPGTDGFSREDKRERGGRINDELGPSEAGSYFGRPPPQGGSIGDQDTMDAESPTTRRDEDAAVAPTGAYFGSRTNQAGFLAFNGKNRTRTPAPDPWNNPRTENPDIKAQGLSGRGHVTAPLSNSILLGFILAVTLVIVDFR